MGFMQLVVFMPLLDVKFPPTALILYGKIINIVTFDILPTDDIYPYIFNLPESDPISTAFEDFDYGTTDYVYNMGSMLIIGSVLLIQFPIYYIAKWCSDKTIGNINSLTCL